MVASCRRIGRASARGPLIIAVLSLLKRYRIVGILAVHVVVVAAAYLGAMYLRFDLWIPPREQPLVWQTLPALVVIRLILFHRHHLFSGWWHYVGISDIVDILKSVTIGSGCFVLVLGLSNVYPGFPRSVILLDWLLTVQFLAGARVASRLVHSLLQRMGVEERREVVIVSSRAMAESLLRELTNNPSVFHPVGFVLAGDTTARRIHQLPVLGALEDLEEILKRVAAREAFIAFPAGEPEKIRAAIRACRAAQVAFRLIAPVNDYLDRARSIESPSLEELFESDQPSVETAHWDALMRDRTVLILGAAGSVGAAMAARIAQVRPRQLLLFDRNESALYYLEVELLRQLPMVPVTPLVGDVLDDARLRQVLLTYRPDVVIHAAALTVEGLDETNGEELRRNNVLGFVRVLAAAVDFGVQRVALLSLDEADLDGQLSCAHRASEHQLRRQPHVGTVACALRFANVVGSARSPVTRIAETLQRGAPVVVPALEARVPICTLRGVTPLLLEAFAVAEDGDVLTIEARETRSVEDIVHYLRRVWNLPAGVIETSAALPDHLHPLEVGEPTAHPRIFRRLLEREPSGCVASLLRDMVPHPGNGGRIPSPLDGSR